MFKTNIKISVLILSAVIFFTSCEKSLLELNSVEEQQQFQNDNVLKGGVAPDWGIHRVFTGEICEPPAINCFDDIIVKPPEQKNQNTFNSFMADGASGVKKYFLSNNYQELFPNLKSNEEYLTKLQSGKYSCITIEKQNQMFYLFGKDDILNKQNFEFVFVLKYIK